MKPLEVFALDKNFNRLTGSIPYTCLQWDRMYYEPGTFEIHVLSSYYSPDWAYIYCDDRPETGIIQKREYTDDQHTPGGIDTIRLLGYFTERWLYNYTFLIEDDVAEEYDYIIKHPPKLVWADDKPEVYQDGVGNVYTMVDGALYDIKGNRTNYSTDGMTKVEYELAPGIREIKVGGYTIGYRDVGYNYYTEDGKLYIVDANGLGSGDVEEVSYSNLVPLSVGHEGGNGNYLGALYSQGGKTYWVSQLVQNHENTWYRNAEKWEGIVKNLDLEYVENIVGNTGIARRVRKVRGPYNRATALDEIGVPRDNVAAIVTWAQRMMGNSILYDEPDFEGETKVLDANLKNFGEFAFTELATVGASARVFYSFLNNQVVFQVWHGRDLTQRANMQIPDGSGATSARSALPAAAGMTDGYPVPTGYTALEYVEGTGTQYVVTGIRPNQSTRVTLDHQLTNTSRVQALFGGRTRSDSSDIYDVYVVSGSIRSDYGSQLMSTTEAVSSRITIDKDGKKLTYGDQSFENNEASFTSGANLTLFSVKNSDLGTPNVDASGVDTRGALMRVYSFTAYDGEKVVLDLVPCRRDQDGQIGFYDQVAGSFLQNDGTGSFVAGPDIERPSDPLPDPDPGKLPDTYVRLQYVESDGTQWIDTGITTDQDTRIVMEAQVKTNPNETGKVGAYFFGSARAYKGAGQEFYVYGGDVTVGYGNSSSMSRDPAPPDPGHVMLVDMDGRKTSISVDGSPTYSFEASPQTFLSPQTLKLLTLPRSGDTFMGSLRVYSVQVYDGSDTMLANLWPARRSSDGSVGLFDTVSGTGFFSMGSGQLTPGPEYEFPEPPKPAEARPWAVFSDTWGSMYDYTYSVDESNYRNTCYVMYDYDEPMDWTDDGRPMVTHLVELGSDSEVDDWKQWGSDVGDHIPYKHKRGYVKVRLEDDKPDIECYLDLRDQKPEFDETWPRGVIQTEDITDESTGEVHKAFDMSTLDGMKQKYEGWYETFDAAGRDELLSKYPVERTLDTGTLSQDDYLEVWDLGDIVDMAVSTMGVMQEARIVGVHEVHESGSSRVTIDLGEIRLSSVTNVTEE